MKTTIRKSVAIFMAALVLFSCQKNEETVKPELPPYESMVIDFTGLVESEKSALNETETQTKVNWFVSAANVGIWNLLIGVTFGVPAASFKAAFGKLPENSGEKTWEWNYSVDGFTSNYTARLVGTVQTDEVEWEMYVTKDGVNPFTEFLWFEGTSALDGNSGQWILNHSPEFPEEVVQIDWKKEGDEVGEVQYTYVRELDNAREPEDFYGSYLIYGLQDEVFDAYVTIHAFDNMADEFHDTQIEWSRSDYSGRIKAEHFYNDTDWHCWGPDGEDIECEE